MIKSYGIYVMVKKWRNFEEVELDFRFFLGIFKDKVKFLILVSFGFLNF